MGLSVRLRAAQPSMTAASLTVLTGASVRPLLLLLLQQLNLSLLLPRCLTACPQQPQRSSNTYRCQVRLQQWVSLSASLLPASQAGTPGPSAQPLPHATAIATVSSSSSSSSWELWGNQTAFQANCLTDGRPHSAASAAARPALTTTLLSPLPPAAAFTAPAAADPSCHRPNNSTACGAPQQLSLASATPAMPPAPPTLTPRSPGPTQYTPQP